jgi:hypothetical protein
MPFMQAVEDSPAMVEHRICPFLIDFLNKIEYYLN